MMHLPWTWWLFGIFVVCFLGYDWRQTPSRRLVSGFMLVVYGGGLVLVTIIEFIRWHRR